ncbi:MAG: Pseudouridine synthase [Verrucomicrobiales bacterium]|nr:Pseudouridine synthase [Verrucomicrobiales bacterium]
MAVLVRNVPPCVLHEDDHFLVVNKPESLNTHAPAPFAGDGIYEWLKHREPHWADLAIIHRLDKETSGVIVFGKSAAANRSLTQQFSNHSVRKRYLLLTDRPVRQKEWTVRSALVRVGDKYQARPEHAGAEMAETRFRVIGAEDNTTLVAAEPLTGKTHQIRVHSASCGLPILGDDLYGGTEWPRLCLHSESIAFRHPVSSAEVKFTVPPGFANRTGAAIRSALTDTGTNAFRLVNGASDGAPGLFVDRLGEYLLVQNEAPLSEMELQLVTNLAAHHLCRGVYQKVLTKKVRGKGTAETSPSRLMGEIAPERFGVVENGIHYELSFTEGYSVGLFLDQRENRRKLLFEHIGAKFECKLAGAEVINTFAYTCAFSVSAALAGARTTSLDLSKKYLNWGKRNFQLNGIADGQDFIFGDTFDWLKRFARKKRTFDFVLLDPPTFSQSQESGVFQADRDYGKLVTAALGVLKSGGILFCSTNSARLKPETFLEQIQNAIRAQGRRVLQSQYVPQPPDFPISRLEPAYLKTIWLRIG